MDTSNKNLKRFKKIPIYVVEEHNDALQFIYSAIGGNKLPVEGTTLLHLDAHPDMLIDRKLKGSEARSGRKLLPLLQIENWITPAAAAGHIGRVVWMRPPWAKQFTDGTRIIHVGDHPDTGLIRVDCKESYYMSDALYSAELNNKKKFIFTVAELADNNIDGIATLSQSLGITEPYVLDIDLDFFSTGNPFLDLYKNIQLYDRLEPIFSFKMPSDTDDLTLQRFNETRENQLDELENMFACLEKYGNLQKYRGPKTELYEKVCGLVEVVKAEADRLGEPPDWWAVFAGGCTRDQGGLPYNITTEEEIQKTVENTLKPFLLEIPRPVLITVARSTDDGYCPPNQVDFIQSLVLKTLQEVYQTDEPVMHYLDNN
ncbi:putative Misexpression suppressor of ras [Danaus plexippus plexippus]|uniref:Misexpression suppressor of ras n=1 Tax=Danaus plexippus plexippus TaxID=278856 RepID=A0A212ELJ4_DANPL|nr:UPF0489 protein C5orf22 homolog [Danaus plexippus plexippus]OWR42370.1 putative Misexpression suppressor of ras [Danaus plexippus plexippus]